MLILIIDSIQMYTDTNRRPSGRLRTETSTFTAFPPKTHVVLSHFWGTPQISHPFQIFNILPPYFWGVKPQKFRERSSSRRIPTVFELGPRRLGADDLIVQLIQQDIHVRLLPRCARCTSEELSVA